MSARRPTIGLIALTATAAVAGVAAGPASAAALNGTLRIEPGSYFRMAFPSGRAYFKNPDSPARDKTYTSIRGGSAGGLVTGAYQGQPSPGFDRRGNSRAGSIIRPQKFAGVRFGLATFSRDPQSRRNTPRPTFSVSGRRIFGQTTALTATWNKLYFNQGSPKPGASRAIALGAYNPKNRRYVMTWTSRISGGPFNGFTGVWRLTGTFVPRR